MGAFPMTCKLRGKRGQYHPKERPATFDCSLSLNTFQFLSKPKEAGEGLEDFQVSLTDRSDTPLGRNPGRGSS